MLWSGPDSAGRRRRLRLLIGIEGVLGLFALGYGIVTALWASTASVWRCWCSPPTASSS